MLIIVENILELKGVVPQIGGEGIREGRGEYCRSESECCKSAHIYWENVKHFITAVRPSFSFCSVTGDAGDEVL